MTIETSLAAQLQAFKAAFAGRVPPARVALMERATAELKKTGIETAAKQRGERMPSLSLPDATGNLVSLDQLLAQGPLVVVFYRGGWCPYCNLELRAWQTHLPELERLGATLVAISPQTPDNSLSTVEKNVLAFPVLSDSELEAASAFGVGFTLPPELAELYLSVGNNLPEINGNGQWVLPIPASFVIDQHGVIQAAYIDADYRNRAEPAEIMDLLRRTICLSLSTGRATSRARPCPSAYVVCGSVTLDQSASAGPKNSKWRRSAGRPKSLSA